MIVAASASADAVQSIVSSRWSAGKSCSGDIELIFRFFKHTLNGQQVISIYPAGMENYFTGMFLTAILHLFFKHECLSYDDFPPPTDQNLVTEVMANDTPAGPDTQRPTTQPLIARFIDAISQSLRLFWKLPKRWLITLAEVLHRPFTADIVQQLNKQVILVPVRSGSIRHMLS
jgi:hypothetical protein